MGDFDENWQIKGSSDPATPSIQPNQYQAQPVQQIQVPVQAQPQTPAQTAPVQPAVQTPVQVQTQAAPVAPAQPVYQQTYQTAPVQPVYQAPAAQPAYQSAPAYQANQPVMPGYAYTAQPVVYQQQADYAAFAAERDRNLAECQKLINHFSPKVDIFQKYELLNHDIEKFSRTSVAPLIWGILTTLFAIAVLLIGIFTVANAGNRVGYYIVSGISFLIGAGLIAMFILKKVSHKKKVLKFIEDAGELSNQLTLLYNCYGECPLAPEYVDPRLIFKLQQLILAGRCATISDALNMLINYQRNYQKIEAAKAQSNATTAARYEGKPAFFNAVSFFNLR